MQNHRNQSAQDDTWIAGFDAKWQSRADSAERQAKSAAGLEVQVKHDMIYRTFPCIDMLGIDRSLSDCIVYTCRRLIDLSLIALYIHAGD